MPAMLDDISAKDLLGGFPEPALVITADGHIIFSNGAADRLLSGGVSATGEQITRFLPEQERSRLNPLVWLRRWAEQPAAPELQHVHLLCRDTAGNERPVRVRVGRLGTQSALYVVMLQDITVEHARQQQTRQAHRLAARVLAISADAIINVDEHADIIYANPSAASLFGYEPGSLTGKPLSMLLPARFRSAHVQHMQRFADEVVPARFMGERSEIVGLTRQDEEIPLEASITKVTMDHALVFSAHLRDLRPRKEAEAALSRSRASLSTVFDHALQAMALISPEGDVLEMNPAARTLLPNGLDPRGRKFAELPFWTADAAATRTQLRDALAICLTGTPYRTSASVQMPSGEIRALDFSLTPVTADGRVFAVVAEARDVARPAD